MALEIETITCNEHLEVIATGIHMTSIMITTTSTID
jgi:hypothetical protein